MRNPFVWEENSLSLGIDPMDQEHRKLIAIMSRLFEQDEKGASKEVQARTLQELADYTRYHFSDEEALMDTFRYPKLLQHQMIHQNLLTTLGQHVKAYSAGTDARLSAELFTFLKVWLWSHIQGIDKQYSRFATGAQVAA